MNVFDIKKGDYHRRLALSLTDITTTGATGVVFRIRPAGGGATVTANGTIISATQVGLQFVAPQLDTIGTFFVEAALTYPDGPETVPTVGYTTMVVGPSL